MLRQSFLGEQQNTEQSQRDILAQDLQWILLERDEKWLNATGRPAGLWRLLIEWLKNLSGLTGGLSVKAIYSKVNGCLLRTTVTVSSELLQTSVNWKLRKGLLHRHTKYFVNRLKKWVVCAGLSVFILSKSTNCNFSTSRLTQTCSVKRSVAYFKCLLQSH